MDDLVVAAYTRLAILNCEVFMIWTSRDAFAVFSSAASSKTAVKIRGECDSKFCTLDP